MQFVKSFFFFFFAFRDESDLRNKISQWGFSFIWLILHYQENICPHDIILMKEN